MKQICSLDEYRATRQSFPFNAETCASDDVLACIENVTGDPDPLCILDMNANVKVMHFYEVFDHVDGAKIARDYQQAILECADDHFEFWWEGYERIRTTLAAAEAALLEDIQNSDGKS